MNEIGMKINNLTIIEDVGVKNSRRLYKVRCDCGKEEVILRQCLFSKNRPQKSCKECFIKRIKEINIKHGKK